MKIYTINKCTTCQLIKEFIDMIQIKCEIIDITENPSILKHHFKELNYKCPKEFLFPILIYNNDVIFGKNIIEYIKINYNKFNIN